VAQDPNKPNTEYHFCLAFRRAAKRALALPDHDEEPEAKARQELLEDLWDFAHSLSVWGTADVLNLVIRFIYDGEDEAAAQLLTELAEEELETLRDPEP
jgi:hypothetical protein